MDVGVIRLVLVGMRDPSGLRVMVEVLVEVLLAVEERVGSNWTFIKIRSCASAQSSNPRKRAFLSIYYICLEIFLDLSEFLVLHQSI